ncbi:MAG: Smr/MutS family protein [Oscillospiraceae bacterium]
MISEGIITLDLHGKNVYWAKTAIDAALRRSRGTYRIRIIHGYNNGTAIRDMIREDYAHHPLVLRLASAGDGVTDLILREM